MKRLSSIDALGAPSLVHILDIELSPDVLGGKRSGDQFDGERVREASNLLKRVCSKQQIVGDYTVTGTRDGSVSVRCGFSNAQERDLIADLAGAVVAPALDWATRRYCVLDPAIEAALNAVGIPRDTRGPGRRAKAQAIKDADDRGLRWKVRGDL